MTLNQLWHGCAFSHGDTLWTQDRLECQRCGEPIDVLPQATIKGPAHEPALIRGTPRLKVKVERKDNVIHGDWRRSER